MKLLALATAIAVAVIYLAWVQGRLRLMIGTAGSRTKRGNIVAVAIVRPGPSA